MSDLYRLIDPERRGWKDDDYIDQLRNSGVLIPVTTADEMVDLLVKQAVAAAGGRLVDREAIDYEAAAAVLVRLHPNMADATLVGEVVMPMLVAAIGDTDEYR